MTKRKAQTDVATETDGQTFAVHAARLLADSRGEDTLVLDVRGISQVTDYFVIVTGTSDRMIRSVADDLEELASVEGRSPIRTQGSESAQWIVVDFFDVVVHLFVPEMRAYYDLESLWGDAKRVEWPKLTKPGQFARITAHEPADDEE